MRDGLTLHVPTFPRLDEYFGQWCFEPSRFKAMWYGVLGYDLSKHVAAGPPPRPLTQMSMAPAKGGKNIAVIELTGSLMKQQPSMGGTSTVQVRRDVKNAAADPNVSAILLRVDSPGGTVSGTADLAAEVKTARKKKPVWAFAEDTCASAAYWIASQADQVFVSSGTALVGSIGTLLTVYDSSSAANDAGVKAMVFATGPLKGAGTPDSPITEEQAGYFQRLVNETQTHFDAAVAKGRQLNGTQLAAVRTGGVFPAQEALDKRLVDGIRSFDSTLEALAAAK